jgi:hypothetical protein
MSDTSLINDDVRARIRTRILEGQKITEIQAEMGLNASTWDFMFWKDYKGFRQFVLDCHDERLRMLARKNLEEVAQMNTDGLEDPRWLKIKTDTSQFIAERVDKERFGKTNEDNKSDKAPITIQVNNFKRLQKQKESLPPPEKP